METPRENFERVKALGGRFWIRTPVAGTKWREIPEWLYRELTAPDVAPSVVPYEVAEFFTPPAPSASTEAR